VGHSIVVVAIGLNKSKISTTLPKASLLVLMVNPVLTVKFTAELVRVLLPV